MSKFTKRPQAETDFEEIWLYIARENVGNADRFIDRIEEKCNMLANSPQIGRSRDDLAPLLRSFPFGNYIIFYRLIENGIEIIRVINAARDITVLSLVFCCNFYLFFV